MKISSLIKCTGLLFVIITVLTLIISFFYYNSSYNKILEYSYNFIVPICIFIVAFIYSFIAGERGLIRGLEIWAIYFLIISILKYTMLENVDSSIFKQFIYIPVAIVAGILGVNFSGKFSK